MFIISNYNKNVPLRISKKNNLDTVESQMGPLRFLSVECNSPVQYFCIKSTGSSVLPRDSLVPAKLFVMETLLEKPDIAKQDDTSSFANLINDFGSKKSKDRIKKRDIITYASKQSITFNIENQILPQFDRDTEDPKEVYSMNLMFGDLVLRNLEDAAVDVEELCSFVKSIYDDSRKEMMIVLDCLYNLLSSRSISERVLGSFGFFFSEVRNDLVRGRLPQLARDKLLVKFYIVLLLVSGFEFQVGLLPKFGESKDKVISLLRIIGCTVHNGVARLDTLPRDTFSTKRVRNS